MKKALIIFAFMIFTTNIFSIEIDFITHDIRPFSYEDDGEIKGFAVDIVTEMMERRRIVKKITLVPFKRGLIMVQKFYDKALFIAMRTKKKRKYRKVGRSSYFKFCLFL